MQLKTGFSSRWLITAGLLILAAVAVDRADLDESTLVATHWKVRPSAARNYRRFYQYQQADQYQQPAPEMVVPGVIRDETSGAERPSASKREKVARRAF
jgi:hypothetical protein